MRRSPAFYVAFVLAPLASNASEFIASYSYASKKTQKTITVSLAALEGAPASTIHPSPPLAAHLLPRHAAPPSGAACMNNTFCLAIFMALVFFQGLAWTFCAETASILLVQLIVCCVALQRTQRTWHGVLLLALFPLSIVFVAALEGAGLD